MRISYNRVLVGHIRRVWKVINCHLLIRLRNQTNTVSNELYRSREIGKSKMLFQDTYCFKIKPQNQASTLGTSFQKPIVFSDLLSGLR